MRLSVHVHPGSRSALVGGSHDGALVVRVRARAVDGAATDEVLTEVAAAFDVRPGAVHLLRGATSRHKVLIVDGEDITLSDRLSLLLLAPSK